MNQISATRREMVPIIFFFSRAKFEFGASSKS